MLADGGLHLSAIAKLAPHLTPEDRDDLLRRATHKAKREVEEIVAEIAPRPDVPATISKLPASRLVVRPTLQRVALDGAVANQPSPELRPEQVDSDALDGADAPDRRVWPGDQEAGELARSPEPAALPVSGALFDSEARSHCDGHLDGKTPPGAERGQLRTDPASAPRWVAAAASRPATIEPLAPARYKVKFTASAELRDKLERLRALMRASIPDGDLAAVIEAALTEKLERLEARRFGGTRSPRTSVSTIDPSPRTRHVPAAVKRAVHERDEGQCRFVDAQGRRCTARGPIELHHRMPWGVGGDHSPGNVAELCRAHNRYLAEVDYGRKAAGEHRWSSAVSAARSIKLETV